MPCIEISLGGYVQTYNSVMREIYADEELAEKLDNTEMSEDAAISYLGMKLFILEQTIPEDSTEFEQTAIVTATNQALILYLIEDEDSYQAALSEAVDTLSQYSRSYGLLSFLMLGIDTSVHGYQGVDIFIGLPSFVIWLAVCMTAISIMYIIYTLPVCTARLCLMEKATKRLYEQRVGKNRERANKNRKKGVYYDHFGIFWVLVFIMIFYYLSRNASCAAGNIQQIDFFISMRLTPLFWVCFIGDVILFLLGWYVRQIRKNLIYNL